MNDRHGEGDMTIYDWFKLLGGVGLFLFGMKMMSEGLSNAAGDKLRGILEKVTGNRVMAVLLGILVTVLIQSSSATDMMVIGFVNSGLMGLGQAIAVIMGANIGTTVTAQITAFNLTDYTPLILFIGAVIFMFMKNPRVRHIGSIIMGFGMLFTGIWLIKQAILPLASEEWFINALDTLENPALAVVFGILFTALLQSSSSSVVIFQTFAVQGLLSYGPAVYLLIGAAIGSVTPNLLAGMTTNRDGKRTAVLNLIFNLFRAALLILLINLVPAILTGICSLSPGDVGRQIANTHTAFAVIAVVAGFPLQNVFVKIAMKLLPDLPEEAQMREEKKLVYMVNMDSVLPTVAVRQAVMETKRLGELASDNLESSMKYFLAEEKDEKLLTRIMNREKSIDHLTHAISDGLIDLRSRSLSPKDAFRVSKLLLIASNIERIGDHAQNIAEYVSKLEATGAAISEIGSKELAELGRRTLKSIHLSLEIFSNEDFARLPEIEQLEQDVDDYQRQIISAHADRLLTSSCKPMAGIVYVDVCTDLERCGDHAISIAWSLVDDRPE